MSTRTPAVAAPANAPVVAAPASTLAVLIAERLSVHRERAFAGHFGAHAWTFVSTTRMFERSRAAATALRDSGVRNGDRVAIVADNSVDWLVAQFGIVLAGAMVVPIFRTIAHDQLDFIFEHSKAKLAFVQTCADAERIAAAAPHAPRLITFEPGSDALGDFENAATQRCDTATVAAYTGQVQPSDLAVLIYTSGTTGEPKGVMLTHENLVSNTQAVIEHGVGGDDMGPVLSVLPFAHIMAMNGALTYLHFDVEHYIATPDTLLEDLRSVRPRTLVLVPRIFERMIGGIVAKARSEGGPKAKLVPWALEVGLAAARAADTGSAPSLALRIQHAIAKRLVLDKVRPAFGLDRVSWIGCGSAPLHRDVALRFESFGLPIREGYGMTEAGPVVTVNPRDAVRLGSVGTALPGVAIRIAADGEIEVSGRGVMKGYYERAAGDEFTPDGWLRTGDVGWLDADGYLFLTERKKELLKTGTGKFVAPSRVEGAMKRSVYVSQAVVTGNGRPYPVALVVPNWALLRIQFSIVETVENADIAARGDVHDFMTNEVILATSELATYEQIRYIALLPRDLTIEHGDLSPAMKTRRRVVEKTFADAIEAMYAGA